MLKTGRETDSRHFRSERLDDRAGSIKAGSNGSVKDVDGGLK